MQPLAIAKSSTIYNGHNRLHQKIRSLRPKKDVKGDEESVVNSLSTINVNSTIKAEGTTLRHCKRRHIHEESTGFDIFAHKTFER